MKAEVEICCPEGKNHLFTVKDFSDKMNAKFQEIKKNNPLGFMDEFESRMELLASDIAQEVGALFDYVVLNDKIVFLYDLTGLNVLPKRREQIIQGG